MKYGCIGEHLKHSFSKEIHNELSDYKYEIKEVPKDKLDEFMDKREFLAINVTIPYKELVIPHLYYIDDNAKEIGAVNTVVNRNGLLYGYNTDFYGMSLLIKHAEVEIKDKKVAVLGTGGTSKTARAVAKSMGAKDIITVSRTKRDNIISYDELYKNYSDIEIIINTTPLGMYPEILNQPVDLSPFKSLKGVIDAVYNPLRTSLVTDAKNRGIKAEGGLYMLVAQAVRASEIFLNKKYDSDVLENVFKRIKHNKENIVLIGMPASGKSTVGKYLAKKLGKEFIDTDTLIEKTTGQKISQIIKTSGESAFREIELRAVCEASKNTGAVIATGGGVPLKKENIDNLAKNGRIYFIDRPLDKLLPTDDRPLTSTKDAMLKKYNERYDIYRESANVHIKADGDVCSVASDIIGEFEV